MNKNKIIEIEKLISEDKTKEAQLELSKMGPPYYDNPEYIYLRGKVFYINKLYYLAIDTLLIALEFKKDDKIYNLIAEIYNVLDNKKLSKSIYDPKQREAVINSLKDELSGTYQKN